MPFIRFMAFKMNGFNGKIGFKKYGTGPEILAKTSKIMQVWFGDLIFGTFCLISWDPVHIFKNRFLRWNPGFKPVVLSTINPIIRRIFFRTYKGALEFKKLKKMKLRGLQMKISGTIYKSEKNSSQYVIHGTQNNRLESRVSILPKKCWKSTFQINPAKFDTFWPISRDPMHIL